MITTSTRIRRVETPDEPTPGAVPPVVPPTTPPAAAPAAAAPAAGAPASAGTSKGLLIGLIAGGAALVVIAVVAVVVLVLPSIFGGGSSDKNLVADITSEPETTWKYDWVGDADEDFIESTPSITSIGGDKVIISASFDSYAYSGLSGDSYGWYEGYGKDYEDGFAAGEEYDAAIDAYYDDFDAEYPDIESYFPEGAYDDYTIQAGFGDGFYDAYFGDEFGTSAAEEPADVDFTPTLTLLNVANGEDEWTVELADLVDDVDFSANYYVNDIEGTDAFVVTAFVVDGTSYTSFITTVSKGSGEVISQLEVDGTAFTTIIGGDIVVFATDEDGEDPTVARYSSNGLDEDPKWETDVEGYGVSALGENFLYVTGEKDDESIVLDASNGDELKWGDDGATYSYVGNQLMRSEYDADKESYEIEGWNTDGDSTWKSSIKTDEFRFIDDAIFVSDSSGSENEDLMRINPSNGEDLWEDTYDEGFGGIVGFHGNSLMLAADDDLVMINASSGEELFSQGVDDANAVYEGSKFYYLVSYDELGAYGYGEKGDVWTFDLDDDEAIIVAGSRLLLLNSDKGTLEGLAAS